MNKRKHTNPAMFFAGIVKDGKIKKYPAWRYHALYEPRIVQDEKQDQQAALEGWLPPEEPITSVPRLSNYFHDLEDFNERQLLAYAKEEFGVEFPREATKERLIRAIWQLYHITPKHKGRMVLLAQSVRMNYDETLKQIQRTAENFEETESKEIWL